MGFETAALLIAAAGSAATLYQQEQTKNAQEDFNDKQRKATIEAMNENLSQIETAKQQATTQAAEKQLENNMAARRALATAKVSAGESGVAGLSVDSLLSELGNTRDRYNDSVTANLRSTMVDLDNQRTNVGINARSQVNQLKTPQAPDYIGAALKIGGALNDYRAAGTKEGTT